MEAPTLKRLPAEEFETGTWLVTRVDRYSMVAARTNKYSVPIRFIGGPVRILLHSSWLVVYDSRSEIARHERLIGKALTRVELDHYLEALVRKPGAMADATALEQARQMSYRAFLAELLLAECDDRARRRSERRIRAAGFPRDKSLRTFDFDANTNIDPTVINTLANCEWVKKGTPSA